MIKYPLHCREYVALISDFSMYSQVTTITQNNWIVSDNTLVLTGVPSKIHDSRIFKLSFIYNRMRRLCANKYHILGDGAYPISPYLLTPYRRTGNLSAIETNYNHKFSATRVKIENAFGLLKQRFRQLKYLEFHSVDKVSKFILACCVLHNICIEANDIEQLESDENEEENTCSDAVDEENDYSEDYDDIENIVDCRASEEKVKGERKRATVAAELFVLSRRQ